MFKKDGGLQKKFGDFHEKTSFKINKTKQDVNDSLSKFGKLIHFDKILDNIRKFWMVYFLVVTIVIFTVLTKGALLTPEIILITLKNNGHITILAMGMLLVIISGNIDLSIGTMVGFLSVLSIPFYNMTGSIIATFLLTILVGIGLGVVQGFLIGYFGIPAFIVTLGGFLVYQGAESHYTKGQALSPINGADFQYGISGSLPDFQIGGSFWIVGFLIFFIMGLLILLSRFYGHISKKRVGLKTSKLWIFLFTQIIIALLFIGFGLIMAFSKWGMPFYVLYMLLFIVLFVFITQNTTFGRAVYAIGGNRKAAKLSGINIKRTTFYIFVIMGMLGGFSGVIFAGITGTAKAGNGGDLALSVISSVFMGGASVYGGVGTVLGTIMGASFIQIVEQFMLIQNWVPEAKNILKGLILVAAVAFYVLINRKSR